MKIYKITVTEAELNFIKTALADAGVNESEYVGEVTFNFLSSIFNADPTNDGAEVAILRVDPQ